MRASRVLCRWYVIPSAATSANVRAALGLAHQYQATKEVSGPQTPDVQRHWALGIGLIWLFWFGRWGWRFLPFFDVVGFCHGWVLRLICYESRTGPKRKMDPDVESWNMQCQRLVLSLLFIASAS